MKLLCISCSNVLHKKDESASTKVCDLIQEIVQEQQGPVRVEALRLIDCELSNCIFCGHCVEGGKCIHDDAFNQIYQEMQESDGLVLVVPFYAVVPSKLTMIMEKVNQIYYTAWLKNPEHPFPLRGKKAAIIAHGGSILQDNPQSRKAYQDLLLRPLNYSLASFGFDVVGLDGDDVRGVVFGVEGYDSRDGAVFPDMVHNWEAIKATVAPLVNRLIHTRT